MYADSEELRMERIKEVKMRELHTYLKNNREGLLPYCKQGKRYRTPGKVSRDKIYGSTGVP